MNKEALREEMRARRRALSQDAQETAARAVLEHLARYAPYQSARCVMAYAASGGELSLAPVIEDILRSGKTLAMPRCEGPGRMTARRVCDLSQLAPGAFGIAEPGTDCEVIAPEALDLILVPGVAFDRAGNRLGQGGGYYDRFLEETPALRAGICHGFALVQRVPAQAHDRSMDAVITPQEIWARNRRA